MGALEGLRVLEFSEFITGPYCGKLMANLGAKHQQDCNKLIKL